MTRGDLRPSARCSDLLARESTDLGRCAGHVEDDPPGDPALEHVVDRLVDSAQRARLADHGCPSASMQVENLIEIFAGPDDGANDSDPVQDRFEKSMPALATTCMSRHLYPIERKTRLPMRRRSSSWPAPHKTPS